MRERSTWHPQEVANKVAAMNKNADPYTMNQSHPQPTADQYVIGDPSSFAEDVHSPNTWETEYKNDQTERDEIGLPEMRSDTFQHTEKTASKEVMLKKADLCIAVSKLILKEAASLEDIENQSVALMNLADQDLIDTHKRLAGEEDDDKEEAKDQAKDQGQQQGQKQASLQEMAQEVVRKIQAGDLKAAQEQVTQIVKQAQGQQTQPQGQQQGQQQQQAQSQQEQQQTQQGQQTQPQAPQGQQDQQQQGQQQQQSQQQQQAEQQSQQIAQQVQKMIQEALQQQQAPAQQAPAQGQQQQAQGQQAPVQQTPAQQGQQQQGQGQQQIQQQVPVQQQGQQQTDEQSIDQMLMADGCGLTEAEIEMEPAPMDMGVDDLGPEDEVLRTLFAQEEPEKKEDKEEAKEEKGQQQASVRTASTRTIGTRPTAGVSKLGGAGSKEQDGIDKLSNLWQSAPDVRDAFGLSK